MSDIFGGGGNTQSVQSNAPWEYAQPYVQRLLSGALGGLSNGSLRNTNPYTGQAAAQLAAGANNPNGLVGQAQNQLSQTIGGKYLSADSNPYLQGAVQKALDQVRQNVNSQFSGDNYGSSANQQFLARSLADTALPIYAQNYSNERQNQLSALNAAPGLQSANAQQLALAGNLADSQSPFAALQRYQSLLNGFTGSSSTTTQPYFTNPLGSAAGGALGGYLIGGPFGAAIGGGVGLLSGLGR